MATQPNTLAMDFVTLNCPGDLREVRCIIFRMLNLDKLCTFLYTCCRVKNKRKIDQMLELCIDCGLDLRKINDTNCEIADPTTAQTVSWKRCLHFIDRRLQVPRDTLYLLNNMLSASKRELRMALVSSVFQRTPINWQVTKLRFDANGSIWHQRLFIFSLARLLADNRNVNVDELIRDNVYDHPCCSRRPDHRATVSGLIAFLLTCKRPNKIAKTDIAKYDSHLHLLRSCDISRVIVSPSLSHLMANADTRAIILSRLPAEHVVVQTKRPVLQYLLRATTDEKVVDDILARCTMKHTTQFACIMINNGWWRDHWLTMYEAHKSYRSSTTGRGLLSFIIQQPYYPITELLQTLTDVDWQEQDVNNNTYINLLLLPNREWTMDVVYALSLLIENGCSITKRCNNDLSALELVLHHWVVMRSKMLSTHITELTLQVLMLTGCRFTNFYNERSLFNHHNKARLASRDLPHGSYMTSSPLVIMAILRQLIIDVYNHDNVIFNVANAAAERTGRTPAAFNLIRPQLAAQS